jgi:hypothetical protein
MPLIFAVCEAVRSWLADNNVKGLDDASMHAQMMRRAKEAERSKVSSDNTVLCMFVFICIYFYRTTVRKLWMAFLPDIFWGVLQSKRFPPCFETCHIKPSAIRTHGQDPVMIIFLLESADKAFFTDLA